jgi:prevent-host-death family protein
MASLDVVRRVLLVEDEPALAKAYVGALAGAGFEVIQATGGKQALRTIETQSIGVVVTEASIPELDGIELVRRLGQRVTGIPIILMLEALDDDLALRGLLAGAQHLLVKPSAELLKQTVVQAVRLLQSGFDAFVRKPADEPWEEVAVTATQAKNAFGKVLDKVIEGHRVVITKHATPKAVVLPYAEFKKLSEAGTRQLNTLSSEFDALLAGMQTPAARAGMEAAFSASPAQLGKAAAAAARKRG